MQNGDDRLEGHLPVCASISAASHTARGEIEDGVFHCHNVAALSSITAMEVEISAWCRR